MSDENEEAIWLALAELFFLDHIPYDTDFTRVADLLRKNSWTRLRTERTLIEAIAPHAGANLGYLIYPVIGAWAQLDSKTLSVKIRRSLSIREKRPRWHFLLSDWWCRRMLLRLGLEQLLSLV